MYVRIPKDSYLHGLKTVIILCHHPRCSRELLMTLVEWLNEAQVLTYIDESDDASDESAIHRARLKLHSHWRGRVTKCFGIGSAKYCTVKGR